MALAANETGELNDFTFASKTEFEASINENFLTIFFVLFPEEQLSDKTVPRRDSQVQIERQICKCLFILFSADGRLNLPAQDVSRKCKEKKVRGRKKNFVIATKDTRAREKCSGSQFHSAKEFKRSGPIFHMSAH